MTETMQLDKTFSHVRRLGKRILLPVMRRRFKREMAAFNEPHWLHLGCGSKHLDGWINIDFVRTPASDVLWNLANPIPLADSCCKYIFHEHVLEHFDVESGARLLEECNRLLMPGGVLRVAMPSLD
jgi:predicted SAM-dependent methyltransferase